MTDKTVNSSRVYGEKIRWSQAYFSAEHDDIVLGGRALRCIRRNYGDNLRETEGA